MTRKKSNVKALALAVTCAILAGGYSGLNPVYAAADTLYKEGANVTTSSNSSTVPGSSNPKITELEVGGVTIGDSGKISGTSITLSGASEFGGATKFSGAATFEGQSKFNAGILANTISEATGGSGVTVGGVKFSNNDINTTGAITASSLKLTGTNPVSDVGETINNNTTNIASNKANINSLDGKIDTVNTKIRSDMANEVSTINTKIDTKLDTSTFGAYKASNDAAVNELQNKTQNIRVAKDTMVTSSDATYIDGITHAGGVRLADKKVRAKELVLEEEFDNHTSAQATLTREGLAALNSMVYDEHDKINIVDGKPVIQAGNGSVVGGVKLDQGKVSGVTSINDNLQFESDGIYLNKGDSKNQIKLGTDGKIIIGTSSSAYDTDGFYAGGHDFAGAKAAIDGKDGKIKGANGEFGVDDQGNVTTTGDIKGKDVTVDGKLSANGDAAVGGKLDVTGNAAVGGTLGVTGAATLGSTLDVTGKATLKDELQVDKKATFGTAAGSQTVINGGDITADGSVTAKGGLSAADGKFTVEGATGNTTVGGTLKSQGNFFVGDADQFTVDAATGNVVSKGKITSENAKIGAVEIANDGTITGVKDITTDTLTVRTGFITNGYIESKGLKVNGNAEITGTLGVDGAVTGASFNGAAITATTFNGATIDATHFNNVTLSGGNVEANAITGTTVTGTTVTDGAGASMNAGTVKGKEITDGVATMTGGNLTGVNSITASGNITTSGTIKGGTLTDGVATMNGGQVTAKNGLVVNTDNQLTSAGLKTVEISATKGQIGNIKIDGATITSNTGTGLSIEGVNINNTALGNVTSIDGVSVGAVTGGNGLQFGGNAVVGATNKPFSSTGYEVDGEGNVTGKSFKVNGSNYLDSTGLTTEKAVIGGVNTLNDKGIDTSKNLHVGGQATFGDSTGTHTTINGGTITSTDGTDSTTIGPNKITTKTLEADTIILNDHMQDGAGNKIEIGADGHLNVAGNNFTIDTIGQMTNEYTGTDAAGRATKTTLKTSVDGINANYTNSVNNNNNLLNINQDGVALGVTDSSNNNLGMLSADAEKATMGYGTANSIVVNKDTIKSALGTDVTRVMTNNTTEQSIVDKVGTASRTLKADEIVDAAGGMTITTNNTGTTFSDGTTNTLIKGSAITSTNGGATGVLNGSSLTLNDGTNSTTLTAGGATFTGAAGEKGGEVTTINGGTITTDTLNVERINLGGEVIDKGAAGVEANSKLYMDAQGNFRAAGGNFKVTGADGAMTNTVGNTTLKTDNAGASMKYNNGTVESNVSVGDNSAMISAGASSIEVKNDGITNNGKTTFKGAVDATVPTTETTINGNTITTGHLITDRLTITGSGAAAGAGTGTIALGGDGSITSNIKDAATGKEATFKTNAEGTFTHAKDGADETTNTVNAQGNTNVVTDGTNTSTATQKATSIGGVVTNGTVTMRQELTADGVKVSVDGDTANYTQITNKDVSITDPKNAGKRINLSDLGQLNDLDGELTARSEYTSNPTAVGAINAEAGIRREEVARLDNRIDDVNNRVDKVGAMAAAIASLKSIGYDPQAPSEFSIGLGQYKGETGVAMGFFHYPNKNFMINVSLSTAGGETMGGIGATWRFGHKSPQKLLDEQREAQARKELAAAEKYQAAAKLAKEAQERAEYAAKLARQAQVSADNAKAAADATQAKHFQ